MQPRADATTAPPPPPRLAGVHHVAVITGDLARAEAFYAGVLGLSPIRRWTDDEGRPRSVWLDLGGGAFLAIERGDAAGPRRDEGAPGWHLAALAIRQDEREAWRTRLLAAGVAIERVSPYTLYVRDPDGNLVGLSHWPEPRP